MKAKVIESRVDKTQLLNRAVCQASKPPKVFVGFSGVCKLGSCSICFPFCSFYRLKRIECFQTTEYINLKCQIFARKSDD